MSQSVEEHQSVEEALRNNPPPEARAGRLRSFLRRGGGVAVETTVEQVGENWQDDEELALFGLEQELLEYQDLWAMHSTVVESFLADEENNDLMGQVIAGSTRASGDRDSRRRVNRLQERAFEQFVAVFVVAGRFHVTKDEHIDVDSKFGSIRDFRRDYTRIESKRSGLFANFPATASVQALSARLAGLEKQVNRTYKPIVRKERAMGDMVYKQITNNPSQAVNLIDTFLECAGSESSVERSFAALLANGYIVKQEESILGIAVQTAESAADQGSFASRYIDNLLAENDGDNMLAFFARQLDSQGLAEPFAQYMAAKLASWPPELTAGYDAYAQQLISAYRLNVKRESERSFKKAWLHPSKDAYEDAVDRLYAQIHGKMEKAFVKPHSTPRQTARLKLSPSETLGVESKEDEQVPLEPALLVRHLNGRAVVEDRSGMDGVLDKVLSREQHDPALMAEIREVIARLQRDPFGSGVRSLLSNTKIEVEGKPTKVYRASPKDMIGLSTSRRLNNARVVFTVADNRLAILAIPRDHQDYEQVIASL